MIDIMLTAMMILISILLVLCIVALSLLIRSIVIDIEEANMERVKLYPEPGRHYVDPRHMSRYVCLYVDSDGIVILQNVTSKWTFRAHGLGMYEDGSVDWDYSTGGHFVKVSEYD